MADVAQLAVQLELLSKDFDAGIKRVQTEMRGLEKGTKATDKSIRTLDKSSMGFTGRLSKALRNPELKRSLLQGVGLGGGIVGFAALTTAISGTINAIGGAISAASDLAETQAKLDQVFKTQAVTIRRWASDSARSMLLTEQAALEGVATFGNFFQALGTTEDAAAEMSTGLVQLAADLASFNNTAGGAEEVLVNLRSGIAGEIEPMRRLGVDISAARVEAFLLARGVEKVGGAFRETDKVAARYALIMEQTTSAQGDVDRTADGLANRQRQLAATIGNLQAQVGAFLIGPAEGLLNWASDLTSAFAGPDAALEDFIDRLDEAGKAAERAEDDGIDLVRSFFDLSRSIGDVLNPAADEAEDFFRENEAAFERAGVTVDEFMQAWFRLKDGLALGSEGAREALNVFLADFPAQLSGASDSLARFRNEARKSFRDVGRSAADIDVNIFEGFGNAFSPEKMLRDLKKELREANREVSRFLSDPSTLEKPLGGVQRQLSKLMGRLPKVIEVGGPASDLMATFIGRMGNEVLSREKDLNDEFKALGLESRDSFLTNGVVTSSAVRGLFPDSRTLAGIGRGMGAQIGNGIAQGIGPVSVDLGGGTSIPGRQHGGPTFPGRAFIVGERGPELRIERKPGQIFSASQTKSILSGGPMAISVRPPPVVIAAYELSGQTAKVANTRRKIAS